MATSRITSLVSVPRFSLRSRSDFFVGATRGGNSSSCFGGVDGRRIRARSPAEEDPGLIPALQTSLLQRPIRGCPRDFPRLPASQTFSSYSVFTKEPHVKPGSTQQSVSPESQNSSYTDSRTSCGIWASNLGREATIVNGKEVLVSATPSIPGFSTLAYKGFVQGCSVRSRDLVRMAKVILMVQFGGEMDDLTSLIQRVKAEAINRLCEDAISRGANAVVGVRLVSSGTHQRTAVEFSAYGTAVVVKSLTS